MLPKFRPATLGHTASARPSIRPVKASPPPPAPSPPRRHESGFGPRSNRAPESQAAVETERFEEEMPTAAGHQGEPSTLNRGPVTLQATPRVRANVMRVEHFDDETQARPVDDHAIETLRREMQAKADLAVDYESLPSLEVRAPYDTYEKAFSERDPVTQLARESARVRRVPDVRSRSEGSYREPAHLELPYQEPSYREPAYQEPSYKEPSYQEPSYKEPSYQEPNDHQDDEFWGRREGRRDGSGARQRPLAPPPPPSPPRPQSRVPSFDDASDSRPWGEPPPAPVPMAYAATGFSSMPPAPHGNDYAAYPQPMIPPAPRVPDEMRAPAFVVGVQPIRTATPDAWGTPHAQHAMPGQGYLPSPMQAMHGSLPAGYAGNVAANQVMPGMVAAPRAMNPTPYPQQQQGYYQRPHPGQRNQTPMPGAMNPSAGLAHPVGAQLTQPPPSAKVGRFAWFVAGAAFGITFAFFATGFFNGSKIATQEFPAAPALTVTAPAAAPVAPPVAAPVAPVVITAAQLPNVPPVAAPQSGIISSAPAPVVSTPPKSNSSVSGGTSPFPSRSIRSSRGTARRPAPAPQGPRALPGSGETDAPAPAAPVAAPSSGGGDLSDLLGAGLKP